MIADGASAQRTVDPNSEAVYKSVESPALLFETKYECRASRQRVVVCVFCLCGCALPVGVFPVLPTQVPPYTREQK